MDASTYIVNPSGTIAGLYALYKINKPTGSIDDFIFEIIKKNKIAVKPVNIVGPISSRKQSKTVFGKYPPKSSMDEYTIGSISLYTLFSTIMPIESFMFLIHVDFLCTQVYPLNTE